MRWKSGYWKNWYRDLFLEVDECEDVVHREPNICEPLWSNAGSPPLADDDRRESPAEHQEQQQGGLSESKPSSTYRPGVLRRACRKYVLFNGWNLGDASEEVVDNSSLTVAGWADANVHELTDIDSARVEFERAQDEQHRRK